MVQAQKLVVLTGATAAGKSELLAALFRGGGKSGGKPLSPPSLIINADSKQFYCALPLLTAQPKAGGGLPHALMGFLTVGEAYSAYAFGKAARKLIAAQKAPLENERSGRKIILVGGSVFYLQSVFEEMEEETRKTKKNLLRAALEKEWQQQGLSPLLEELKNKDEAFFQVVDQQNPRRVLRALEVIRGEGVSFTEYRSKKKITPFESLRFVLYPLQKKLHKNIRERTEAMFRNGVVEEVAHFLATEEKARERLLRSGIIGGKEVLALLEGRQSESAAKEAIIIRTRQLAKQQRTWFKREGPESLFLVPDYQAAQISKADQWLLERLATQGQTAALGAWDEVVEYVRKTIKLFYG